MSYRKKTVDIQTTESEHKKVTNFAHRILKITDITVKQIQSQHVPLKNLCLFTL